jgi:hypothetical protein
MSNLLSPLNITDVNQITQQQINNVMNVKLIIPELIILFVLIYACLFLSLIFIKGTNSKIKVSGYLGKSLLFTIPVLVIICIFPNSIYQLLNLILNY